MSPSSPPPSRMASTTRDRGKAKAKAEAKAENPIVIESDSEEEEEGRADVLQYERDRAKAKRPRVGRRKEEAVELETETGGRRTDGGGDTANGTRPKITSSSTTVKGTSSSRLSHTDTDTQDVAQEAQDSKGKGKETPSPPSLGGLALGLSLADRKAMERERLQRQRERRRAQGLKSDSETESETEGEEDGGAKVDAPRLPPPPPLPTSSAGSLSAPRSNVKSRSYVSEVDSSPRRIAPIPSRSTTGGSRRNENISHGTSRSSGGGNAATGHPQASALSGLGGSQGSKPALRRILADDRFWDGTVKRSWNRYTGDGVPFSDLILPTTRSNAAGLIHAVLASYTTDYEWLGTILPTKDSAQPGRKALPGPELTFLVSNKVGLPAGNHAFAAPGWNLNVRQELHKEHVCPHMKFLLLFYPDRLRLAILTGNMIEFDWSTLENAAYLQDFPLLPGGQHNRTTDVYDQLTMILISMGLPRRHAAFQALSRYDLSKGPAIVASLATDVPTQGWDKVSKVGLGRLAVKSREILGGAAPAGGLELEAQGSSMGLYSQRWLQQFHLAASGHDLSRCLPLPPSQPAATRCYSSAIGSTSGSGAPAGWPPVKVVFPTKDFVLRESMTGPEGGGCHYGKPDTFHRWRHLCYQARGARLPGLLMHQKAILAVRPGASPSPSPSSSSSSSLHTSNGAKVGNFFQQSTLGNPSSWPSKHSVTSKVNPSKSTPDPHPDNAPSTTKTKTMTTSTNNKKKPIGWVYLGSANFTMAAWGNLSLPSSSSSPSPSPSHTPEITLTANNWELGVLLPLHGEDLEPQAELSTPARSAICWERPLRAYRHGGGGAGGAGAAAGGGGGGGEEDIPWLHEETRHTSNAIGIGIGKPVKRNTTNGKS